MRNRNQQIMVDLEIQDTSGDEHLGVNRMVQYQDADVFMVCIATNNRTSLENLDRWRNEIQSVEQSKPILLVLTKSDLMDDAEDPVELEELQEKCVQDGFQGCCKTSSKVWD